MSGESSLNKTLDEYRTEIFDRLEPGKPCWFITGLSDNSEPSVFTGTVVSKGRRVTIRLKSGSGLDIPSKYVAATLPELQRAVLNYTEQINRNAAFAIRRAAANQ